VNNTIRQADKIKSEFIGSKVFRKKEIKKEDGEVEGRSSRWWARQEMGQPDHYHT
jgi:hypothetical protein